MGVRRLVAVAVVGLAVGVAADAQHGGGGHGGGGGGGFASHGGGGFAGYGGGGGRVGAAPGGFARSVNRGGGGAYAPRNGGQGREFGGGVAIGRPGFYHRGGDRRRGYRVPYGYGGGIGYGDYGYLDANDPDADSGYDPGYVGGYDSGYADNGSYDGGPGQDGPGVGAEGYGAQGYPDAGPADGAEGPPVPFVAERARTEGGYSAPAVVRSVTVAQGPLYNSDAVTLVFRDGRAQETIHNYVLTRSTVYVTDGRRREIPVASLDLAATEKANRAAGVPFRLPGTP